MTEGGGGATDADGWLRAERCVATDGDGSCAVTDAGWRAVSRSSDEVLLRPCENGPVLVRHADVIVDPDGVEHDVTRPVVAVCACGRSQRLPWCDATHKSVRRQVSPGAPAIPRPTLRRFRNPTG